MPTVTLRLIALSMAAKPETRRAGNRSRFKTKWLEPKWLRTLFSPNSVSHRAFSMVPLEHVCRPGRDGGQLVL